MPAARVEDAYELSPLQEGMLFHALRSPGSGVDVAQVICHLDEATDVPALARAWTAVVGRHAILRTRFRFLDEGKPIQEVCENASLPFEHLDWRGLSAPDQEARWRALLQADRARGFDLSCAPAMRLCVAELAARRYRLLWSFHHILLDGRAFPLVLREVFALYDAESEKQALCLPRPQPYGDYIRWLRGLEPARSEGFWRHLLRGVSAPTPLGLPCPRGGSGSEDGGFAARGVQLSSSTTASLSSFARENEITLATLVQGAWAALLHRYSREDDVVFGVTRTCRRSALDGADDLIGLLINTLPLRVTTRTGERLVPWLRRIRSSLVEVRPHEHTPLAQVQAWSELPRGTSLFDTIVVFDHATLDTALRGTDGRWECRRFECIGQTNFGVTLVAHGESGLLLSLEYYHRVLNDASATRLLEHLVRLLESMPEDAERSVESLPLLNEPERQRLLVEWNPRASFPKEATTHRRFEVQAERAPGAVALRYEDQQLTYEELNRRANQLAHYLRELGVGPDVLVGLCVERSVEMVVGILGILKAGGAYLPLDPSYPKERLAFMLVDSGVSVLLTQERLLEALPSHHARVVCLDSGWPAVALQSEANPASVAGPDHLAYVIYTSGSTGQPKGVPVTHANVVRLFDATEEWFHFTPNDVWTLFHSYAFDFSVWELWGALFYGGRVVVVPYWVSRSPEAFYELLCREGVTVLSQTPSAFRQLMQAEPAGADPHGLSLRLVVFGGEALELQSLSPWLERHGDRRPQLVNMYGITETTVHVTYRPITLEDVRRGAGSVIGVPIPDLQVYVLDGRQSPVPIGVPGEMCVGGAGVARGYLNRPELTAERFVPDPFSTDGGSRLYRSGDLARWLEGGDLEYLGRIDHQVKIRGFRVELGEIEALLGQHPAVKEAVVVAREDVPGEKRLVAYVASGEERPTLFADLRERLREALPEYMVPAAFVAVDKLPLTANGKVDRKALPAPGDPGSVRQHVAPRTPTEEILAGIWRDVLHTARLGVEDDFFELGGHSLVATQVVSRIRRAMGVELPLRTLFAEPTVARLASRLETLRGSAAAEAAAPPLRTRAYEGPVELSFAQERMWLLDQVEAVSSNYAVPGALKIHGPLDRPALERALGRIVERHEALRTFFPAVDGQALQVVAERVKTNVSVVDLEGRPEQLEERLAEEARRGFDLARGPLFRAVLYRLGASDHMLLLTMHHIVSDGLSLDILVRELGILYGGFTRGEEPRLPALPAQYRDFALWQREWLQGEVLARQLEYWTRRLAGAPRVLDLPADHPRPSLESHRGAVHSFAIPRQVSEAVTKMARREGATLFMVLIAAFEVVLWRYTGQEDLLVGTPVAGRNRAELEGLVGLFVNTLVMRADLSRDPTVRELLGRVREACLGAYSHQDLPFERLVQELAVERDTSRNPLFQVMFSLQNAPASPPGFAGLDVTLEEVDRGASHVDLTLQLLETEEGLRGTFEYATDLFERETIARWAGHFRTVLEGVTVDAERRISALPVMPEPERRKVVDEWNATGREYPLERRLDALIEAQAERSPERVAVVAEEGSLSYRELDARANQLARFLGRHAVGEGTLVGIAMERSLEMVVGLLGVLRAGGAYVPLDPTYPRDRLAYMMADSRTPILLTQERLLGELPAHGARAVPLDAEWMEVQQESPAPIPKVTTGDGLAYVIYTSGSTGKPKGAMNAHRGIVNRLLWMQEEYALGADDVVLQKTPFSFDVSVWEFFWPLLAGARLVMARPEGHKDPGYLVRTIVSEGVTTMHFVPAMLQAFLEEPGVEACTSLRRVICSGEALGHEVQERFFARLPGVELHNLYGPTEAAVDVTYWACRRGDGRSTVPIGRPVANTRTYVLDRSLCVVPVGVAGELYIGGVQVGRGYLGRPDLTAERFVPDPFSGDGGERLYRTGDVARWLPEGVLEYLGRVDHQVKIRGFRVELGEIEVALRDHPLVNEAIVLAREETPGDRRLVAYCVLAKEERGAELQFREWLRARLPEYMVPSAFVFLDGLPLSPSGKVDRKALPAPDHEQRGPGAAHVPPQTPMEETLSQVWCEVLGRKAVGVEDNFFDVGGNSLLLIRVVARARQAGLTLTPLAMFRYPTVRSLASALSGTVATVPDRAGVRERARRQREAAARQKKPLRRS